MIYAFGDCELDTESYELRRDGARRHVEPQVFDVLAYLLAHRRRLVTREELLGQVWGHTFVSEATLSSRVKAARSAIGDSGRTQALIRTVRGRGYQFIAPVEEASSAPPIAVNALEPSGDAGRAIGREAELAELSRLLDAAVAGTRQFALVTGEAGMGKTTLVEAFVERAASDAPLLVANGRCTEPRGAVEPYMPILEALARICQRPGSGPVVATLVKVAPTWASQLPGVLEGSELEAARARSDGAQPERMLREIAAALETLGSATPVLLVIDDLHWADASTLALVAHVARRDDPAPLLIIGTARPIAGGQLDELRRDLRPRGRCSELVLPPFAADEVRTYLEDRYPRAESLAALVHERTEGNPLFVECLLRWWVETGALAAQAEGWGVRSEDRDLASDVPDTLRDLLDRDIDRLSGDERGMLEVASAVGPVFSAAAVAAGLGVDLEEVEARCGALARRGSFLRERGEESWPDATVAAAFGFVHELHRQLLYERIPAGRRTRLHAQIARRLEAGYGTQAPQHAAELSAHYLEARESESAARYLQLAAERALSRGAHRDAADELRAALDLVVRAPDLPDRAGRELSLRAALAGALVAAEGWSEAAETAHLRGLELARELRDHRSVAVLLYGLASLHEFRGDYPGSQALLEEALRVEGMDRDAAGLLEAHELLACSLFHQGSFDAAVEHADRGLSLAPADQRHPALAFQGENPAVSCNDWAGLALWCLGQPDQALDRITAGLELASEQGREYSLASARVQAARLHQLRREPHDALTHAEAALELASDNGFSYFAAAAIILLGWALSQTGHHDRGLAQLRDGLDAHRATGASMDRPYFLALLAEALGAAGLADEGLSAIAEAIELIGADRSFFYEAELHRLRGALSGQAAAATGADEPATSFRRALEIARRQGARSLALRAALSLAQLLRARGASDEARATLSESCAWFGDRTDSADLREARELLGELERDRAPAG